MNGATLMILAAVFLTSHASAQQQPSDDDVLARVGPHAITVGEFRQRMDLMPWPGKDNPEARDSAKILALASLVAEKLLSLEAAERGMAQSPATSASLAAIERLLARNELYRVEAVDRVQIDSAEIATGLERYASLLRLNVFVMDSQHHAERLAAALGDTTRRAVSLEGVLSHDTVIVSYGDLHPAYEDVAFALSDSGEARAAYADRYGWAVFQLLERASNPAYANKSIQERLLAVKQKLRKRKEGLLAIQFAREVLAKPLVLDSTAFHLLADSLHALMLGDSAGHRQDGFYSVRGDDADRLRTALGSVLGQVFARTGEYTITVGEIVGELKFFPLRFPSLRKGAFLKTLNQDIRLVVEAATMSQEAKRRNLHQRPEVRREMAMWIEAMQAERLLKFMLDSLARMQGSASLTDVDSARAAMKHAADAVNAYIASLADRQKVMMDFEKLRRVAVTPSNMVTRRFIGFGGSMMAAPMLPHLWEWLDLWRHEKTIAP